MSEGNFILEEVNKDLESLKREMQNLVVQRQQADERIAMQRGAIAYIELLLEKTQPLSNEPVEDLTPVEVD